MKTLLVAAFFFFLLMFTDFPVIVKSLDRMRAEKGAELLLEREAVLDSLYTEGEKYGAEISALEKIVDDFDKKRELNAL